MFSPVAFWGKKEYPDNPEMGVLVMVAFDGTNRIAYSTNGTTWTSYNPSVALYTLAYGASLDIISLPVFSASGTTAYRYSDDKGVSVKTGSNLPTSGDWRSVRWSQRQGKFIACSFIGTDRIAISTDGINWVGKSTPIQNSWKSLAYSPKLDRWVCVGQSATNVTNVYSDDGGDTWTAGTLTTGHYWGVVRWISQKNLFIAAGSFNPGSGTRAYFAHSTDGINWTVNQAPSTIANAVADIAYSPKLDLFVAIIGSNTQEIQTSTDGINWSVVGSALPSGDQWRGIVWSEKFEKFYAISRGRVTSSSNGTTWSTFTTVTNATQIFNEIIA
jgi:hypothetical protein